MTIQTKSWFVIVYSRRYAYSRTHEVNVWATHATPEQVHKRYNGETEQLANGDILSWCIYENCGDKQPTQHYLDSVTKKIYQHYGAQIKERREIDELARHKNEILSRIREISRPIAYYVSNKSGLIDVDNKAAYAQKVFDYINKHPEIVTEINNTGADDIVQKFLAHF